MSSSLAVLLEVKTTHSSAVLSLHLSQCFTPPLKSIPASFFPHPLSPLMDPKSRSHLDTLTMHVSCIEDYICPIWRFGLYVDEPHFYYASFRIVVGERCMPYGSRKPRFRKANALIIHTLVNFEKILAAQHVSTERWQRT